MIHDHQRLFAERNILAALNVLGQERRVSRASIARATGLTPATVSRLISRLEEAGIVRIGGAGESTGGRKPLLVEFLPDAFYLAGVDIGVTKAIVLVIDLHGRLVAREKIALDPEQGRETGLAMILAAAHRAFDGLKNKRSKISGIGLSIPGMVDTDRGIAIQAPNLSGWGNTPLVDIFRKEFGLYCCLENDAKAMALGEARLGAGVGCKNMFTICLGRGIGGGLILNGELYRGSSSTSGEIGHITVNPSGPTCSCGNRGCLEVMASGPAIAAAAMRILASGGASTIKQMVDGRLERITAKLVNLAALEGDPLALRLLTEAAEYIGIGLATVVNLFGPERIIISGGVASAGDFFLDTIRKTVAERAYTYARVRPDFVRSELGDESACIGAAALVLENMLTM